MVLRDKTFFLNCLITFTFTKEGKVYHKTSRTNSWFFKYSMFEHTLNIVIMGLTLQRWNASVGTYIPSI